MLDSNPGHDWLPDAIKSGEIAVSGDGFKLSPYVTFVSTKGPAFGRMVQFVPDLEDGDPVLVRPEPQRPERLAPFRFFLLQAFQHWSIVDQKGQIVKSTFDPQHAKKAPGKWDEHVETVLMVVTPKGLVCARCTFKTTKTNAAHRAIDVLNQLKRGKNKEGLPTRDDWFAQSADHKVTLAAPYDWARFTSLVRLKKGVGAGTGFAYVAATSVPQPATAADWVALGEYFKEPSNVAASEDCVSQHNRRRESVASHSEK